MALEEFLPVQVYALMLVFARVGSMLIIMPGIGEGYVTTRVRIYFALAFALVVAPVVQPLLPEEPPSIWGLFLLVFYEVVIGLYFGLITRIALLTMDTVGRIISFQTGLAAANIFNPAISEQGSLIGLLLTTLAILFLFIFDFHHLLLLAIVDSYELFQAGAAPPFESFADALARVATESFRVAVRFSAPFIVVGLVFYACLGILARLMPQLQIFFIGIPVQLILGFAILALILSSLMGLFIQYYGDTVAQFLVAG